MGILSSRECAMAIWAIIFVIYLLIHKKTRREVLNLIKIFFSKKFLILWLIPLVYVCLITFLFSQLSFWKKIYIKDVVIWFLFSGLVDSIKSVGSDSDSKYIRKVIKDNLKLTIVVEFFLSTFTFNIFIELIIIPIVTLITIMNVFAEQKKEYTIVHKLLDYILIIFSFWMFYDTIKLGIHEYKELNDIDTFISFMIPIVYLILMIPLDYLLMLYSKYELLFFRMFFNQNESKKNKIEKCIKVIKVCNLSIDRVLTFQKKYSLNAVRTMTTEEFDDFIKQFKNNYIKH